MRRLLSTIAVAALCILVWLNVHVKTSSHSAHAAEHEEHAERGTMQFLHRIFGEDLGKMHEDGFSREAWSKAHHAAKEANRNEQAPNSIANLREDGHPSLDSLGSEMRHVMHDVVERTKKLKFSIPLREHNILGTRSDIKGSLSLHNVGAEDGEVGGKARVGAAANGSGYLDNAKWIQDLVAATYPQGYRAPVTIHKESEFADDPTVRTAPRGDSSSERAAADTVPAAQTVSGFLDSSQWVKNLVEATYPEGSEQWTAKHPKHEEREDQHEGEHVVVGGFLENTKWIQDLIEATYPDGYDASPTMSDHDGEEPADADANADFGGTAKVASPRGGYLDSSEWIQKIVDATYVDGHEHKNAQAQARENTQQLQHKVDEGSQDDNVTQSIESKSKGEGEAGDYHGSHVGGAAHLALEAARDAAEASHHTAAKAEAEVMGVADHSLEDTHDSGDAGGSRAIRTRMLSDVRRKLREHPLHKLKGKRAAGDVRIDSQL